jgi:hypothetical protein
MLRRQKRVHGRKNRGEKAFDNYKPEKMLSLEGLEFAS